MEELEKNSIHQFNGWADWYDSSLLYWLFFFSNKKVLTLLNPQKNSTFLDVGCGTGILLDQLVRLDRNIKLHGLDISEEMIVKAKEKLGKRATLIVGSANKLPYKSNSFDYVTCCTSLHHHPSTKNSMAEFYRVVKPGGKVLVLDLFVDGVIRKLIYTWDNIVFHEKDTFVYTKKQMQSLFHSIGFRNIEQQTFLYSKLITIGKKT
jgi:ubiquinone/menaquinone biosynthesis C-methylase UbiE